MREAADVELRAEVAELLFHEASLLDRGRLDEWLELYTDDATYWIPLQADQSDPLTASSIVYDDRRLMEARVRQFQHPRAHARVPAPRTVHQVGNVRVLQADGRDTRVGSTLVLVEYRRDCRPGRPARGGARRRASPAPHRRGIAHRREADRSGELGGRARRHRVLVLMRGPEGRPPA